MSAAWTDHACRFCGSRLLVREGDAGAVYECGNCTMTSPDKPDAICGCGLRLGAGARPARRGPRFHCVPNPDRSALNPAAVVIRYGTPE